MESGQTKMNKKFGLVFMNFCSGTMFMLSINCYKQGMIVQGIVLNLLNLVITSQSLFGEIE